MHHTGIDSERGEIRNQPGADCWGITALKIRGASITLIASCQLPCDGCLWRALDSMLDKANAVCQWWPTMSAIVAVAKAQAVCGIILFSNTASFVRSEL